MGNCRFRLSDMFSNAWFYKLRGTRSRKKANHPSNTNPSAPPPSPQTPMNPRRASCYIPSRHNLPTNPDPPRRSKKKHRVGRSASLVGPSSNAVSSSVFSECPCRTIVKDDRVVKESSINDDLDGLPCFDKTVIACSNCQVTSSAADIIIDTGDVKGRKAGKTTQHRDQDLYHLPPILTKKAAIKEACSVPKSYRKSPRWRSSVGSQGQGLRMRANTPRLAGKKFHSNRKSAAVTPRSRRGISTSFAVVKSSSNPLRDFRHSMTEMIVENNIRAAPDLEELLACYLSLNSNEYHDVIVKVFKQIWFDLLDSKL